MNAYNWNIFFIFEYKKISKNEKNITPCSYISHRGKAVLRTTSYTTQTFLKLIEKIEKKKKN